MPHRTFTVEQVAEYLHLGPEDVRRLLREAGMPHSIRGGRTVFLRSEVDAWASQRILGLPGKRLDLYHARSVRGTREVFPHLALIPELLRPEHIDLALPSKTRASVLRDVVALAARTERVTDAKELLKSVEEREAMCSTGLPGGIALLHARHHADFRFDGSFIVLGRAIQPVPFSAPDGRPTSLFFLICCDDDRIHLHVLARLCLVAQKTDVVQQLFAAATADAAYMALVDAEAAVLPSPDAATSGKVPKARRGD